MEEDYHILSSKRPDLLKDPLMVGKHWDENSDQLDAMNDVGITTGGFKWK